MSIACAGFVSEILVVVVVVVVIVVVAVMKWLRAIVPPGGFSYLLRSGQLGRRGQSQTHRPGRRGRHAAQAFVSLF